MKIKYWIIICIIIIIILWLLFLSWLLYIFEYEYQYNPQVNPHDEDRIRDFYDALYFLIVTITSVGFGDIHPFSPEGRRVTSFMSLTGVILVALISALVGDCCKQLVKTANHVEKNGYVCSLLAHDRDIFHKAARSALEKDGWAITHDPLSIKIDKIEFYIDLGAERILAAEKDGKKIAVEIKSFIGNSEITEFHLAIGQYLNYRSAFKKKQPERFLYLAITVDVYRNFFSSKFIQEIIVEHQLKLLIFDFIKKEVVLWKE